MRLSLIYSRSQTWCRRGKSLFLTEINSVLYSTWPVTAVLLMSFFLFFFLFFFFFFFFSFFL